MLHVHISAIVLWSLSNCSCGFRFSFNRVRQGRMVDEPVVAGRCNSCLKPLPRFHNRPDRCERYPQPCSIFFLSNAPLPRRSHRPIQEQDQPLTDQSRAFIESPDRGVFESSQSEMGNNPQVSRSVVYPFVTFTTRVEARSLGARTFPFVADVVERVCASPWTSSRPQDSRRAQVLPQARCVTRAKRSASRCGGQLARSVGCERESR